MICYIKRFILLNILLHLFVMPCYATWYQGSASHTFSQFNFDKIRSLTIKRAVANATMQDLSYIQMEDIVLDGLLTSSKTLLRSEGQLRRIEILDESINDNVLSITVKVDIKPAIACTKDKYAKSTLIAQFPILKPEQAKDGALFTLGTHVSQRFENQLNAHAKAHVNVLRNHSFIPENHAQLTPYITRVGRYLATEYDSQFIIFGAIRDISLFEQVKEQLIFDDISLKRNFTIELYLYDAIRNKILLNKDYHGEANWQFNPHLKVDINNSVFWRSKYGRAVLHTINNAVTDINDLLQCQQSIAQVIHDNDDQIVINMGENQGVKIGDTFKMINQRMVKGFSGKTFTLHSPDNVTTLSVVHVDSQHAVLVSDTNNIKLSSQLANFVTPKYSF